MKTIKLTKRDRALVSEWLATQVAEMKARNSATAGALLRLLAALEES